MTDLYRLLPGEMDELVREMGQQRYRADQVLHGLYRELAASVEDLHVLPGAPWV